MQRHPSHDQLFSFQNFLASSWIKIMNFSIPCLITIDLTNVPSALFTATSTELLGCEGFNNSFLSTRPKLPVPSVETKLKKVTIFSGLLIFFYYFFYHHRAVSRNQFEELLDPEWHQCNTSRGRISRQRISNADELYKSCCNTGCSLRQ